MSKTNIIMAIGTILVISAVGLFVFSQSSQKSAAASAANLVEQLQERMPEVRDVFLEETSEKRMPMLEIDSKNLVGIIEVPAYGRKLPIGSSWDKTEITQYPHRYWGSIYEKNLIIGGSENKGQLDFVKSISNGDVIYVTDATGARCNYQVTEIERTTDVTSETLVSKEADLTLFTKSTYAFEYIIVRCDIFFAK